MQLMIEQQGLINLPDEIKRELINNEKESPRFKEWFQDNIMKIKSKYSGAVTIEDKKDVTAELICAASVLKLCWAEDLIYEPFGREHRAPDFKAIISGQELYIEVKRIRKNEIEYERDKFIQSLVVVLKQIKQNYGVSIKFDELKIQDLEEKDIYVNLRDKLNDIKEFIELQLEHITQLEGGNLAEVSLKNFAENFSISVLKVPIERQDGKVHFYGSSFGISSTGVEYRKFGDIIFDKVHQLIPNRMNVVFVFSDNECYEFEDLLDSIQRIAELVGEKNQEFFKTKGFDGIENFLKEVKKIGGIIFYNKNNEKKLWINKKAVVSLSEEVKDFVTSLNA